MTLLFDISPDEPTKKRHARASKTSPAVVEEPIIKAFSSNRSILPIGRLDEGVACIDPRCGTACHDILTEDRGEWLLQCCFCNCTQWVPVIQGQLQPREEQFVFRDGRFAGLSIDEAAVQPRGRDYVEWAAREHKRPAVQAACKDWLDRFGKAL